MVLLKTYPHGNCNFSEVTFITKFVYLSVYLSNIH